LYTCIAPYRCILNIVLYFIITEDRPLIVQFAAKNAEEFANAAEIVAP
jgi:hypothetical protein